MSHLVYKSVDSLGLLDYGVRVKRDHLVQIADSPVSELSQLVLGDRREQDHNQEMHVVLPPQRFPENGKLVGMRPCF